MSPSFSQAVSFVLRGFVFSLVAAVGLAQGQDSGEMPLREGIEAYRAHHPADAVTSLRIAAFGLLNRPPKLCEALVYLALANEAAGYQGEAQSTLDRLAEAQRRTPGCAEARVDPAARAEFESRFQRKLPAAPAVPPPTAAPAAAPKPAPSAAPREAAMAPTPAPVMAPEPTPSISPKEAAPQPGSGEQNEAVAAAAANNGETPARIKTLAPPVYPAAAREARAGGTVILHVLVSETGKAMQVDVVQAVRPDLADAAVVSMQYCTFEPARRNGQPVRGWTTVEVPFRP